MTLIGCVWTGATQNTTTLTKPKAPQTNFRARKSAMAFAKQYALAPKAAMLQVIKVNMLST
ncbi:hypothetical protein J2792_003012 [Novosphingobium capsulatum]|uniref:Uncharacterized protein n=1 Tax=Novosphingobium capsulatum TaxID=13688 RepID=A0ABU1MP54_9SPHN|nr:hypothetical protein [Novosphingobium capsulatum]MDR6512129.1 hypothetical protein [Novosphingobium capsulatum]